jgi:DNA-binding beta-propeller fold protein YncE
MKRFAFLGGLLCMTAGLSSAASPIYRVVEKIPVPGDGGWDYLSIDPAARRLYISHGAQVQILDLDHEKIVGTIADTPGVHGIAIAAELGRGYTSNGKEGTVTIFDLKTTKPIDRVKVRGENPDAIVFEPVTRRVFTFNGRTSDATALDAVTGKVLGRIPLGGRPEFAVASGSGTIYDVLEDKSLLVRIDAKPLTVQNQWPLAPCDEPSAVAIDRANARLFIGCGNKILVIVDANTGRVIGQQPIGDHVDATAFDPDTRRIFSSNGDGTLTVIQQDDADHYHILQNVATQRGARTVALDPKTHALYLATAEFGAPPEPTAAQPHPRPALHPGTFAILKVDEQHI